MTGAEQVSVNMADLEKALFWGDLSAVARLKHVIPVPEWRPTDDMRPKARTCVAFFFGSVPDETVDAFLKALHREGLL